MQESIKHNELDNLEDELSALLKSISIYSITDKYGRIIFANDKFCEIMGSPKKNIIGETHKLIKSHLHSNILYKELWKTIKSGKKWKGILPNNQVGGKYQWLETTITPIKDNNNDIAKYISVYSDITDYYIKMESENIADSNLKEIKQNLINVVLSVNSSGRILNAHNKLLNKDQDKNVGMYIYDFISTVSHKIVKKKIKKVFNERKASEFETIELSSRGHQTFLLSSINPVFNENKEMIYATITTKRIKDEVKIKQELKQIEAKYSTLFQSINVGIAVADEKGNITEWNKGAELVFGYSENEILGNSLKMLLAKQHRLSSIKDLIAAKNSLNKELKGNAMEVRGLKKSGEEFPVELALSSWTSGKEMYYCAVMLDITERENLEYRLKQKTKDLDLMLYRLTHAIKTPLTSTDGLNRLLEEDS